MIWLALLRAQAAVPTQIDRGEALFYDAARGCGSCHALKGKGTAVGPDLMDITRLSLRAIPMAFSSTSPLYVQVIMCASVHSSPGTTPDHKSTLEITYCR